MAARFDLVEDFAIIRGNTFSVDFTLRENKQIITFVGTPTGGTYKLDFAGERTADIAYDADATTIQVALASLRRVGSGNVTVTGNIGGPFTVEFSENVESPLDGVHPLMKAVSSLTPNSSYVSVNYALVDLTGYSATAALKRSFAASVSTSLTTSIDTANSKITVSLTAAETSVLPAWTWGVWSLETTVGSTKTTLLYGKAQILTDAV